MNRRPLLAATAATTSSLTGCLTDYIGDQPEESEQTPPEQSPRPPEIADHTFEVTHVDCDNPESAHDVTRSDGQVTVTGSLRGSTTCGTAALDSVEYDADSDELRLVVRSFVEETEGGCGDCIVEIEYEATVSFDYGEPGTVTVDYTGDAKT